MIGHGDILGMSLIERGCCNANREGGDPSNACFKPKNKSLMGYS
jgi:hypothetical protein